MNRCTSDLQLAMRVHAQLVELVDPVTPDTIRSSLLKTNKVLLFIASIGGLGFIALIASNFLPEVSAVLIRLSGAILGSTLYAFWTARTYLQDSTFGSRYSQDYVVRFGIGVVAGFVLGSILTEGGTTGDEGLQKAAQLFGPFTLAIVGGYSAEAVVQILNRIAEVLVTTIRGGDKEQAKLKAERTIGKKLNRTAAELQEALQNGSPEELSARIQEIARKLLKE